MGDGSLSPTVATAVGVPAVLVTLGVMMLPLPYSATSHLRNG
ncbi:UNVERIFIED_ORG: hypothetical protein FHR35_007262 [Microbispora rosea subsp. rosea]